MESFLVFWLTVFLVICFCCFIPCCFGHFNDKKMNQKEKGQLEKNNQPLANNQPQVQVAQEVHILMVTTDEGYSSVKDLRQKVCLDLYF